MALMTSRVKSAAIENSVWGACGVWALMKKLWAAREGACGLR